MRRIETIDSRVTNNIVKTDSVISKLRILDQKLFQIPHSNEIKGGNKIKDSENTIDMTLNTLDKKVNDIDKKLVGLKNQLDLNALSADDIRAEASEKKPIHIMDTSKILTNEIAAQVSKEVKSSLDSIDRKWNYQRENINRVLTMVEDIHFAIVEPQVSSSSNKTTTPAPTASKIDKLAQKMNPILSVSEKMDEVWNVVVGTKSSVDDLVPKSDELLTQTQRQERAISNIHNDLKTKANKIIENLNLVDKRLKKQEDEVMNLATRPVPAEFLLDPTIDRLVEYDNTRYPIEADPPAHVSEPTEQPLPVSFTTPTSTQPTIITASSTTGTVNSTLRDSVSKVTHRGIIFPSVKNKPSLSNTTFTTDIVATIKDIKVSHLIFLIKISGQSIFLYDTQGDATMC